MKFIAFALTLCSLTAFAQNALPTAPISPHMQAVAEQANAAVQAPEQAQSIASLKEALLWQKKLFKLQISAEKTQAKLQQEKLRIEIAQREAKHAMSVQQAKHAD